MMGSCHTRTSTMISPSQPGRLCLLINPHRHDALGATARRVMSDADAAAAADEIRSWPDYAPTPLVALPALARQTGIAALLVKHEGHRFAVGSFKALGPSYAALRAIGAAIGRRTGTPPAPADLMTGRYGEWARGLTLTAATSGNHGRAVAWSAQRIGAACRIYMHSEVSPGRAAAIAAFGAEIIRVPGTFDDALARCRLDATQDGALVIADLPDERAPDVPRHTIHGYGMLGLELIEQAPDATHVFVGAGIGSLAAATVARLHGLPIER
ncbi:MAG: pyridoxal-phosphate dependent enzyme, partial [Alphaproteobacteria bacterium]|nr:pyridoxal-phosphate dependent enzyme [Alphaproteobacteria bacterium]